MLRFIFSIFIWFSLVPLSATAAENVKPSPQNQQLKAYTVLASAKDAQLLRRDHFDITAVHGNVGEKLRLEIIMTLTQSDDLRAVHHLIH